MERLFIDWPEFIRFFNATLKKYGSVIEPIQYVTEGKKKHVQRIVDSIGTKQVLIDAVVNMAKSDLCNARVRNKRLPKGLIGSFTWLTYSDERIINMANGDYNPLPEQAPTAAELRQQRADEREEARRERERIAREEYEREHERMAKERERWAQEAATPEQIREIMKGFRLPKDPPPHPSRQGGERGNSNQ